MLIRGRSASPQTPGTSRRRPRRLRSCRCDSDCSPATTPRRRAGPLAHLSNEVTEGREATSWRLVKRSRYFVMPYSCTRKPEGLSASSLLGHPCRFGGLSTLRARAGRRGRGTPDRAFPGHHAISRAPISPGPFVANVVKWHASFRSTRQRAPSGSRSAFGATPCPVYLESNVLATTSTIGSTHACLLLGREREGAHERHLAPQAGLGHFTVRAQSQAMTVASAAVLALGSATFG